MNSVNTQPKKALFNVFSAGRKVEGEFGSKMAAKKFRDKHNANLKPGDVAWWVGAGKDHWRSQHERGESITITESVDTAKLAA